MKKIFVITSLLTSFLIFGTFALIFVREQIVYPLQDVQKLNSSKYIEEIKRVRGEYPMQDLVMWNAKVLDVKPKIIAYDPQEDTQVLGDTTGNWIEINLSAQSLCFHETSGATPCFAVSTGMPWTPTPTGDFHVWIKLPVTTMAGPGYYLPGIHWTMYFYNAYSTHEAYWHNNFGQPMSHGCVNMRIADAKYIYDRSEVGTLVRVHN
jgi:hypothetical protein